MGTTAANGKTPPNGQGDPSGTKSSSPLKHTAATENSEKPRAVRRLSLSPLWRRQARPQARGRHLQRPPLPAEHLAGARTEHRQPISPHRVAQKAAIARIHRLRQTQRFQWFWKAGTTIFPDLDNGGSGMITLQEMLMQTDGKHIYLLPAWPKEWSAEFKTPRAPCPPPSKAASRNGKSWST